MLITSGRDTILYDTGPAYRSDSLIRSLRRHGVNQIHTLILSHASANHAGGAVAVLEEFPVGELWHTDFHSRSPAYNDALALAQVRGVRRRIVTAGETGEWDRGLAWDIMHPASATAWGRAADASIVIRLSRGTVATLLTGGGGHAVEQAILQYPRDPTAAVWIMGSGGTEHAASDRWLQAVSPQTVVVDVSPFNRHRLPARDVTERLDRFPSLGWTRTDEDGTATIRMESRIRRSRQADRWSVRSARAE